MAIETGIKDLQGAKAAIEAAKPQQPARRQEAKPEGEASRKADEPAARKRVEDLARDIEIKVKKVNTELKFEVDKSTKDVVVKIIDSETGGVIRQIPSEEILKLKDRVNRMVGVLCDLKS